MAAPPKVVACPACGRNTAYDRCVCGQPTGDDLIPFAQRRTIVASGEAVVQNPTVELVLETRTPRPEPTITKRVARRIGRGSVQHDSP